MFWTGFFIGIAACLGIGLAAHVVHNRRQRAAFIANLSPAEREKLTGFEKCQGQLARLSRPVAPLACAKWFSSVRVLNTRSPSKSSLRKRRSSSMKELLLHRVSRLKLANVFRTFNDARRND